MLRGAVEAGLLALINDHIARRTGNALAELQRPQCPNWSHRVAEARQRGTDEHRVLVGVGDASPGARWPRRLAPRRQRHGLAAGAGQPFGRQNRLCWWTAALARWMLQPATPRTQGLSDPDDPLKPDVLVPGGPEPMWPGLSS